MLRFVWDPKKEAANRKKHGVSFKDAEGVFHDDRALLIPDPDHSSDEDRFLALGLGFGTRLLVVCHTYVEEDAVIRIISARPATRRESRIYARRKG